VTDTDQDGFEYQDRFYPWHITDMGKDLMLIDRICGLSLTEFYEVADDALQQDRAPVLLALIATSIRAGNPSWSVERIVRLVMDMKLSDVKIVGAEEGLPGPPAETAAEPPTSEPSRSPSNGSSPPSTPPDASTFATSSVPPM
jgi:hypothetical protein